MKKTFFAAALTAIATLGVALPTAAQDFGRFHGDAGFEDNYRGDRDGDFRRGERWRRDLITIRKDGRVFSFDRGDRMFYRLLARPYNFEPGLTYAYTDRCNRYGCVAFVFDNHRRRPIDRIFAPHLRMRGWAYREARGFDRDYRGYGDYERDDRGWNNDDDRNFRYDRDHGQLDGGPARR